jgi:hypothetical protein
MKNSDKAIKNIAALFFKAEKFIIPYMEKNACCRQAATREFLKQLHKEFIKQEFLDEIFKEIDDELKENENAKV